VLERYVRYWQLKSRLDDASPEAVQAFMTAFHDGPLADRLRVEWLKVLGRRGDWNRFALDYPPASGEDTELACLGVQYRLQRDGAHRVIHAGAGIKGEIHVTRRGMCVKTEGDHLQHETGREDDGFERN